MDASTWTIVGALAAIVSALGIAVAVFRLRSGAWVKAQEIFTNQDFVRSRTALFSHFDNSENPWPDPSGADALRVCRRMDEMAHLWKGAFLGVGQRKVLKHWGNPIAKAWLLLERTVESERDRSRLGDKWQAFEQLGKKAVRRTKLDELRNSVLDASNKKRPQDPTQT